MNKYGKFAILMTIIVGSLGFLAYSGIQGNTTYYKTITELGQMGNRAYNARIRVGGDVETGSIQRVGSRVEFVLAQENTKLKVAYTGTDPLPVVFIALHGPFGEDGYLQGRRPGAGRWQTGERRRVRG